MKLVGLKWSSETNNFEETPIDVVDNMYIEGDLYYPDGSYAFVGRIIVKLN